MNIFYNGKDITDSVTPSKCSVKDCSDKCDSIDIEFENAAAWYEWQPEEDDQILVSQGSYNSGVMFLNAAIPESGKYRIIATSIPCIARRKNNKSFINKTIGDIMHACAVESGMAYQIFGIDENIVIPYVERENEGCAAFLQKLLELEGAVLKCVNGKYVAIGVEYAQNKIANQAFTITANQESCTYERIGNRAKTLTVYSPYAKATAKDAYVTSGSIDKTIELPVMGEIQAGRWARNKLLSMNRKTELFQMGNEFNQGLTAMIRLDIEGSTDASGEWLISEVEHDLINLKSTAKMHRCTNTIM